MTPGSSIPPVAGLTDGRENFKSEHNYFAKQFVTPSDRAFVISEYGGYTCQVKGHTCSGKTYGYKICSSPEEFQTAYHKLMAEEIEPLKEQGLCGAVYTQLSDIEDEINGLMNVRQGGLQVVGGWQSYAPMDSDSPPLALSPQT